MTLMARWSGTCPQCGERWQPGEFIRADEPEPGDLPAWQHATCPDPLTAAHPLAVYGLARAGINPDHLTHPTNPEQE